MPQMFKRPIRSVLVGLSSALVAITGTAQSCTPSSDSTAHLRRPVMTMHQAKVGAYAGSRVTTSVLLAAAITALGKGIAGRALPGVKTPHSFSFGRGFHDDNGPFVAFPSGHTAAAFALATALTAEAEHSSYGWSRLVRPIAYTAATGVAIARVYQLTHWVSDLPLAAVIGMWSGSVVESQRKSASASSSSSSKDSDVSLGEVSVVPYRRGIMVGSSFSFSAR
jgi:membrane-associated phospholipid phosphatase